MWKRSGRKYCNTPAHTATPNKGPQATVLTRKPQRKLQYSPKSQYSTGQTRDTLPWRSTPTLGGSNNSNSFVRAAVRQRTSHADVPRAAGTPTRSDLPLAVPGRYHHSGGPFAHLTARCLNRMLRRVGHSNRGGGSPPVFCCRTEEPVFVYTIVVAYRRQRPSWKRLIKETTMRGRNLLPATLIFLALNAAITWACMENGDVKNAGGSPCKYRVCSWAGSAESPRGD